MIRLPCFDPTYYPDFGIDFQLGNGGILDLFSS